MVHKELNGIEHRIELYWPSENRERCSEYSLWVHDEKTDRVSKIPSGSKILFYETAENPVYGWRGAKTIFAAGTLTDFAPEDPDHFTDKVGRVWRESRVVKLDSWVKPATGVSLPEIRKVLNKHSNWKMRTGPYPITAREFMKIHDLLLSRDGAKAPKIDGRVSTKYAGDEEYRSLSQKNEEESVKQQAAELIKIKKIHNILTNKFSQFARQEFGVVPEEEFFDILLRVPETGQMLLVEAKSASGGNLVRHQVRQGVGQLFDYRFVNFRDKGTALKLAILLPDQPEAGIIEFLSSLGIGVIWSLGDSFAATEDVRVFSDIFQKFRKQR